MVMPNTYKKDEKDHDCLFYLGSAQEKKGTFKPKSVDDTEAEVKNEASKINSVHRVS
jgi:hypothetical protein